MATTEPKPVKQLRELLQEQQEPFTLEIHLIEKGYLRKSLNSQSSFNCCHGNSRKSLKKSVRCGLNKTEKGITHCSKVLSTVYNQVISINERVRTKSSNRQDGKSTVSENGGNNQQVQELDRFSSASSTTVFNSCSETDAEETSASLQKDQYLSTANSSETFTLCIPTGKEAVTDRRLLWQSIDRTTLSPVSVLEDISRGDYPIHDTKTEDFNNKKEENPSKTGVIFPKKVTEDCIFSASISKVLRHSATAKSITTEVTETQGLVLPILSSQYLKSKTVLQQTKQLLFDCIKEIVENQGRKKKRQHCKEFLGSKELGERIVEKIKSSGKQSGDESNLTKLLDLDILDSAQEWSGYEPQKSNIALEIGNAILEEIRNEIVTDIIDFLSSITRR